ncbi:Xaa-Pro peptidase family protein [Desulfosarcina sp. OttesenSCG-928-G10]|nr:Xaa-Pro peptidase family protein [Desulfosarcina sp. OttesenSCG-928-G10]MDL2320822.1 Xaa-Pro peptidase family protein [Desulfosarcina sp. OttesenSCG-928-B08]
MNHPDKHTRIKKLQETLAKQNMDVALINLSRDVYYYTGTAQPACLLLVTPEDYRLFVKRALDFVLEDVFIEKDKIEPDGSFKEALACLEDMKINGGRLGVEMDVIPAGLYLKIKKLFHKFEITDVSHVILQQRMKKDEEEISFIKNACKIMDAGHGRIMETLTPGMTELQLAAEVEYAHRRAGHEGNLSMRNFDFYISRGPLCAGQNLFRVSGFANTITGIGVSPAIPAGPSNTPINAGDLVVVDIPTCHNGYHSDQTRTYIIGNPSEQVASLFQKLKEISDVSIHFLKNGITCKELFDIAHGTAKELGVEAYFLGLEPRKGNFLGHGIGLDANEPPILFFNSEIPLKTNYVLTIEIHLTHPEFGAVKLEDVVRVGETHTEILTCTPRELFVIK